MFDGTIGSINWNGQQSVPTKASVLSGRVCASRTSILLGILLLLSLCSTGSANDYYSGQQYTFSTQYNANWNYLWDATLGSNTGIDKDTFVWTAPVVTSPTEITISVIVSVKNLPSCKSMAEIKILAKPLGEVTVVKRTVGGEGTFPFEGTGFTGDCDLSSFSLSPSNSYTAGCTDLTPGTYSIIELVPAGWDLTNIEITGDTGVISSVFDHTSGRLDLGDPLR